ncbi:MAG: Gfo/Idh/MocA family oxidoreductase [Vicinamibacteria bacterium]|nr:Gfo/Idh/MocA family oxidoreductase [Vicinamibacteria bacterium]
MKIGLVGCGYWGKNIARNLHQMGLLGAVCDPSTKILDGVPKLYPGALATKALDDLLKSKEIDAIAIASPAAEHAATAKAALMAGKDVFVEKPLALDVKQAKALLDLAKRRKRILMVGHILCYHPAIQKLKQLVDAGDLGDIQYVYSNRLNLGKIRHEENILWSFAPHDISVILLLLGRMPSSVTTAGESWLRKGVADVTMTTLKFNRGARAHIFVSWLHPFKEQKLVVVGSKRMAVFDDVIKEGKLKIFDKGVDWLDGQPVIRQTSESTLFFPELEPLREELTHFADCVRTRKEARTDGKNGLDVLRVLDAGQRSLDTGGKPVAIR